MNLANLGLAGITVAQNRLQTAGHNINNAATDGYNRQSVLVATAGASPTAGGYIGRGVQAVTVQRAYDSFLSRQLVAAQSAGAASLSYGTEIKQINNLLADRSVGIAPALQKFFDGMQAVASAPADSAARQELLGRAAGLVSQLNDTSRFLDEQRGNINTQLSTVVTQINSYAERIRDLNQQITSARAGTTGHEPNDLLDQRDQLVSELNQLVDVRTVEQDGVFNLTVGSGQVLLGGDTVYPLSAQPSAADPARTVIAYSVQGPGGSLIHAEMDEDRIRGGKLGGLLDYRREALDTVQNQLGRLAVGLATAINTAHATGVDLAGEPGEDFFSLAPAKVIPQQGNAGTATLTATIDDANALTAQDYVVARTATGYTVTRIPGGTPTELTGNSGVIDGVAFDFSGGPAAVGDSWVVQPVREAAAGIGLAISDPAAIAAAAPGTGTANGDVALEMAQLQTTKVLGNGSMSLNESFSQIVNKVGVLTQQNATEANAQSALIKQNYEAQQAVSGVNLNEEYINLQRFQEQFQASARLIDVSGALFDTLLGLRG
ncbi:flagellar hook-associated protein FlgK [Allopusillimonas soli]|uniref:Flagellar hook-associated protein 1 n=1 Tax=Allopusillimonas soli TaxID=659016 RepID=A0A853F6B5_9BURK|nr:flagellar hook-associated protein FlgK [Allopusillimonas soli]NYT35519.1 flagellar hook-associated protein FlgK [Allopusillimonas soli]TEA75926.1 flagellar hook-associated protein FlgK [Allopusillimonas soli]